MFVGLGIYEIFKGGFWYKINYPIEFLLEDQFFLNGKLTDGLGNDLFIERADITLARHFPKMLKGENENLKLQNFNKIKENAKFLLYSLKNNRGKSEKDSDQTKTDVAEKILKKANEEGEGKAQKIFYNFKPTISLIKKKIGEIEKT